MIRRTALVLLLASAPAVTAEVARPRAAGGVLLVETAESAPATLVGEIRNPRQLDTHGYAAQLRVETPLSGPLARGDVVSIAWEELAASRAPRFAEGERVLVSLEALPGHSIWRQRLPDAAERSRTLAVARRGEAFLRRPGIGSVNALAHYLALAPPERAGGSGAGYLVALVAQSEPPLARDALRRLGTHAQLAREIDARLGARLAHALLREDADPAFRAQLAALIGERQLETARLPLQALAARQPPPPPEVFAALAQLEGGLSPERSAELLASESAAQRRVAARHASGADGERALRRLLRSDPDSEVRAEALDRLAVLRGEAALELLVTGLSDAEIPVRNRAARRLAALGPPAVAPLRQVVDGNDPEAAAAAVVALGLCDAAEARVALAEISDGHADRRLRALADIALGRPMGHRH